MTMPENVENNSGTYGLEELTEAEGYPTPEALALATGLDSITPAICRDCGMTTGMEPDQAAGWCEECQACTVVSVLVLMGLI